MERGRGTSHLSGSSSSSGGVDLELPQVDRSPHLMILSRQVHSREGITDYMLRVIASYIKCEECGNTVVVRTEAKKCYFLVYSTKDSPEGETCWHSPSEATQELIYQ
jgi:succinyl-CoA synthetase beta subunit